MKRILSFIVLLLFMVHLTACGSKTDLQDG